MALPTEALDRHMKAIGIITVRWSSIDGALDDILRARLPAEAEKLRQSNAGMQRFECFLKLIKGADMLPYEKRALADAVKLLMGLWKDRNLIANGQYGIVTGGDGSLSPVWSYIRVPKGDGHSGRLMEPALLTIERLTQHADDVSEAAKPLRDFLYRRPAA
jgi:hypothetical protein